MRRQQMWLGLGVVLAGSVAARHKRLRPLLPRLHLPCLSLLRVLLRPLLRPPAKKRRGGASGESAARKAARLAKEAAAASNAAGANPTPADVGALAAARAEIVKLRAENEKLLARAVKAETQVAGGDKNAELKQQVAVMAAQMKCGAFMMNFMNRTAPAATGAPGTSAEHTPGAAAPTPQQLSFDSFFTDVAAAAP